MTKHKLLLLSHPWEHTHPAAATSKHSGQFPPSLSRILQQLVQHLLCGLSGSGCFLHGLQVAGAKHHSYH